MASVKIILRSKSNKDGTHALAIQITKDRKKSLIHLGQHVKKSDWDALAQQVKSTCPNHKRLNNLLLTKKAEASNRVLEAEAQQSVSSARAMRNTIKPRNGVSFFPQAQSYLDTLEKAGKYNRYSADKPRIKRFREFLNNEDIAFSDITVTMLNRFKAYLKGTRQITDRTVVNHLVVIRSVFSHAIKDKVADPKYYPFGEGKIQIKFPDSLKVGWNAAEIKKLEEFELPDGSLERGALDRWLFSFYFAGMRAADVLLADRYYFNNQRFLYSMGKNNKADSFKVHEKAQRIIDKYSLQENRHGLLFPDLASMRDLKDKFNVQKRIKTRVGHIDHYLKKVAEKVGVDKKLTMHIARHSFGNISGDKIPVQLLQKLYRHTSITTTIAYQQNFIHRDTDDALDAVLNF